MKINFLKTVSVLSFLFVFAAFAASAVTVQAAPNLRVQAWQGQNQPFVESPYQYTTRVGNIGNSNADNVKLVIEFPLTNTSPQQHILGKLTGIQSGCQVVSNKLECNLGTVIPGDTRFISFNFEFQVATTAPTLISTASTNTSGELNPNNNWASITPILRYRNNPISSATVLVTSCSGTGLTSFYECELYPSSQQSFVMELNQDHTISIPIANTYTGIWDQLAAPTNRTLHFTIADGGNVEAEFNGFAVSSTCFEGIATFPGSTSGFNAAYRVCEQ